MAWEPGNRDDGNKEQECLTARLWLVDAHFQGGMSQEDAIQTTVRVGLVNYKVGRERGVM
jgi:hypothetical protein